MTRIFPAFAVIGLMSVSSVSALAQTATPPQADAPPVMEQGHHGKGRHGDKGQHGGARMIDANFDNVIGDDEAAGLAEREFNHIDNDRNGTLTEAEFTVLRDRGHWWQQWTQTQDAGIADGLKAKFAALDADKNGSVTKAEFLVDAKARYAAADADKDGKVTPWEFRAQN